jgi:hypothetical protein
MWGVEPHGKSCGSTSRLLPNEHDGSVAAVELEPSPTEPRISSRCFSENVANLNRSRHREPDNVFVSDELIMAFADGELDPPLASHIRQAIHADAALRRKHEIFCSTRVVLARAFDDALEEPVPERLKSAVRPN